MLATAGAVLGVAARMSQPEAGCAPTTTPPPRADRDLHDPPTRPRRWPPPWASARRMRWARVSGTHRPPKS